MASILRRAATYLGLGPDEAYAAPTEHQRFGYEHQGDPNGYDGSDPAGQGGSQTVTLVPRGEDGAPQSASGVRMLDGDEMSSAMAHHQHAGIGPPEVIVPHSFDDTQAVAEAFKRGSAVIVNLQNLNIDIARRLVDFCAGLCYGRDGEMSKAADGVYLLVPSDVVISIEHRRRIKAGEYA